jgi:hypothetical protein
MISYIITMVVTIFSMKRKEMFDSPTQFSIIIIIKKKNFAQFYFSLYFQIIIYIIIY